MKCKMCMEKKNGNIFALEGSKNFQRSGLERHQNCDDHKLADTCIKQANVMSNYVHEQFIKRHPAFEIMASAVAYMVSEEINTRSEIQWSFGITGLSKLKQLLSYQMSYVH